MTLKDEIERGETNDLEFKRIPNEDRAKFLKTVVAFANGKGGRILFGVNDDRTICGISRDILFQEMDAIVDSISDACEPRVPVDIGIEHIDGMAVVVLDVLSGSHPPYYIKSEGHEDGVYVRVGATTRQVDDATRRELAFLGEGRSFDGEPCLKAKIDDKRVNEAFRDCGLRDLSIDDTGFATRMNVYRATNAASGALNVPTNAERDTENDHGVPINVPIKDRVLGLIMQRPGMKRVEMAALLDVDVKTIARTLAGLAGKVEHRGSKKTGGYYLKTILK